MTEPIARLKTRANLASAGLDEAVRNRLLRRVDWRFLLANPWPDRTLCLTGGSLARALELVSDQVVDAASAAPASCDLAAVCNPSGALLQQALSALKPGGYLYGEWTRPFPGEVKRVRRRLSAAGFVEARAYWPWPPPMPSQAWLPLDAPAAIREWRRSQPGFGRLRPAALRGLLRAPVLAVCLATGIAIPLCVVARKPGLADGRNAPSGGNADLATAVEAGWSDWGFGAAKGGLSWLLATGGWRSINKVVALVSARSDGVARVVVKLPRVPESIPALEREAAVLQGVHAEHPGGLPGVPRVLRWAGQDGQAALVEDYLAGAPLYTYLSDRTYRDLAFRATDWLVQLAGHPEARPKALWWERLIETPLASFASLLGSSLDDDTLRQTRASLATLESAPLVWEHRDYSPWNVFLTPTGGLAVLDWESAEPEGLPMSDLVYFLTYLAFMREGALDSGRFLQSYLTTLDATSFTGQVRQACLSRYGKALGLDPAILPTLEMAAWLAQGRPGAGLDPAPEAGGRGAMTQLKRLSTVLWREDVRRLLGR